VSIPVKQKLKVGIAGYGLIGKRRRVFIDEQPPLMEK
jgi:glyceraldehyde-3-phosphate dehydrogenase/erythrose-4-phosphate dehydrogenase